MNEGHSKSSNPHPERRAIAVYVCHSNTLTTSFKTRKTNFNFCPSVIHAKVKNLKPE